MKDCIDSALVFDIQKVYKSWDTVAPITKLIGVLYGCTPLKKVG